MKLFGVMIRLRPEHYGEYKRLHAAVWPEVLAMIESCNVRNYTIFHHNGMLFGSYEYHGTDHAADMAKMASNPATQRWWALTVPMQRQIEDTPKGEWWMPMEELFHFHG